MLYASLRAQCTPFLIARELTGDAMSKNLQKYARAVEQWERRNVIRAANGLEPELPPVKAKTARKKLWHEKERIENFDGGIKQAMKRAVPVIQGALVATIREGGELGMTEHQLWRAFRRRYGRERGASPAPPRAPLFDLLDPRLNHQLSPVQPQIFALEILRTLRLHKLPRLFADSDAVVFRRSRLIAREYAPDNG